MNFPFFDSRMLQSNTCESLCGLLECGAVKQREWPACFARTVCLRIGPFRTGNRAGTCVRSFNFAKARQMAKFARCPFAKTITNCSNSFCHFHLISSVSRTQRPLIKTCIELPLNKTKIWLKRLKIIKLI